MKQTTQKEAEMKPLKSKIAVVAGATREAGRGIGCMLREAGERVWVHGHRRCAARPGPSLRFREALQRVFKDGASLENVAPGRGEGEGQL